MMMMNKWSENQWILETVEDLRPVFWLVHNYLYKSSATIEPYKKFIHRSDIPHFTGTQDGRNYQYFDNLVTQMLISFTFFSLQGRNFQSNQSNQIYLWHKNTNNNERK